jgi:hypothetical protein
MRQTLHITPPTFALPTALVVIVDPQCVVAVEADNKAR